MKWPDYLQVWPGHGAGSSCGKSLGAVPQTTVGYEKMFNPSILAAQSETQFVEFILAGQPEPPLYFANMKRDNKMGPKVLGGVPKLRHITAAEMKSIDGHTCAVMDTRPWADFKAGHIAGALSLRLSNSFNTDAGSVIDEHEKIYLIVQASRLDEAVRDLIRVGLDNFAGWFEASDMKQYEAEGGKLVSTDEVSVAQAQTLLVSEHPFVLDARRKTEFTAGHLPGAVNIAHTRLLARIQEVPKNRSVLVNCLGGGRSSLACSLLQKHGYQVANLAGGFNAWQQAKA